MASRAVVMVKRRQEKPKVCESGWENVHGKSTDLRFASFPAGISMVGKGLPHPTPTVTELDKRSLAALHK